MAFSRAFSTKKQPEIEISAPTYIGRAASQRGGRPVVRAKISSPTALLSTSNAQVHNAHTIDGRAPIEIRHVSSGSSSDSNNDSDTSGGSVHSYETDATSVDNSPIGPEPEPNHLSAYFKPAVDTHTHSHSHSRAASHTSSARPSFDTRPSFDAPRIPQRAPSHSKRAHEGLHRKRSIQRMLSPPPSRGREMNNTRSSTEIFGVPSPVKSSFVEAPKECSPGPFANELAQLDEVAEELGQVVKSAERDADSLYMERRGLARYSANDYMWEIQGLIHDMFRDEQPEFDFGFF